MKKILFLAPIFPEVRGFSAVLSADRSVRKSTKLWSFAGIRLLLW